jgi:predicted metallo-beta-lactamase superfamily hydrolase
MMLRRIKVIPLAAESLGVRSLCTYIKTSNFSVLLDAGVSLSPNRFGLPPHPQEYNAINNSRLRIAEFAKKAIAITISHYHFDHHTPSFEDWVCNWTSTQTARQIYQEKLVFAKDYRTFINASQRRRGWVFRKTGGKHTKRFLFADGKTFAFNETKLKFSFPVFHGSPNTPLGWVVMTTIEHQDEKVMFASDVQGPMDNSTMEYIQSERPQMLIVGGPPLYLAGFQVRNRDIQQGLKNLKILVKKIPVVILEHHLLRDSNWSSHMESIFKVAQSAKNEVMTAAEFLGEENQLLEAKRRQLFQDHPPNSDFKEWTKLSELKRQKTKPPI